MVKTILTGEGVTKDIMVVTGLGREIKLEREITIPVKIVEKQMIIGC